MFEMVSLYMADRDMSFHRFVRERRTESGRWGRILGQPGCCLLYGVRSRQLPRPSFSFLFFFLIELVASGYCQHLCWTATDDSQGPFCLIFEECSVKLALHETTRSANNNARSLAEIETERMALSDLPKNLNRK